MFNLISLKNGLENVDGFYFGGLNAGFKVGKNDLGFIRSDSLFDVAAIFTSNKFKAAPIRHFLRYNQSILQSNFLLLNSKNANAMTGQKGVEDIDEIFEKLEQIFSEKNVKIINPIMSSTGVIGYRLNKEKIILGASKFNLTDKNSSGVCEAIMTTDSFEKQLAFRVELENGDFFNIACITKGAGMINPAFATMLCFILTDANIPQDHMHELINRFSKTTFNAVSVDGDTSTNDTIMLLTSRKRQVYDKTAFSFALEKIMQTMALNLLKDGEGSTKVVAFEVIGAKNDQEAQTAAKALSNSLLVKTALFGEDPNWGRIASTIGASGVECSEENLVIKYDDVLVFDKFNPELNDEREQKAHKVMQKNSYKISCHLGVGNAKFIAYGCDLGHDYVKINADYRT